ncbi:DLH domain-containing protein [Mycena chlorophos]|uniref:DLH domain-containing protein n=1 Tax=Mycena chlorophos TaxID=658473 RepID=A0A8H6VUD4_MYCCL|nr:DLH domain-containing protein [Mycena chlorophos]
MSCPNCFTGEVLAGEPTGSVTDLDGSVYYFAPGPDGASNKRAIILLTDVFGLPLKNSKLLADSFAQCLKCDVYVPDLFEGKPPVTEAQMSFLPDKAGVKLGFGTILKILWKVGPSLPSILRKRPAVGSVHALTFAQKLQASKHYEKLGAVGYCYGGGVALILGSDHPDLFNSIVLAHPSPPTDAQILAITAPVSWALSEDDMGIKPPRIEQIKSLYNTRETKVDWEVNVYPGTAHGFAARPAMHIPEVKDGFEKAFQQTVEWFNKTIPA